MLPVKAIILLLEFCLKNAYFSFQGQYYEQVEGVAMGSLLSPIIAYLYMEYFEQKALKTVTHPSQKYGSGMCCIVQREENKQSFLQHINDVDPAIK